jgi:hypothetical protein
MRSFLIKANGSILITGLLSSCTITSLVDSLRKLELAQMKRDKLQLVHFSKNVATQSDKRMFSRVYSIVGCRFVSRYTHAEEEMNCRSNHGKGG